MNSTNITDGIKNIIFDLGGVIINIDHHRTADAFHQLGAPNFIDYFSHSSQNEIFDLHEKGKISDSEFRNRVMKEINLTISDELFDEAWNAILLDIPKERIDLLIDLKSKFRIFMLSNTNSIHMQKMDQYMDSAFGIPSYKHLFEKAYYSFEMGVRKPNKDIFEMVLRDSGLLPEETLFIDDSEPNIFTAQQMGIRTLHFPKNSNLLSSYLL